VTGHDEQISRASESRSTDCASVNFLYNNDSSSVMDRGERIPVHGGLCMFHFSGLKQTAALYI